jgi:hypothetical protein
VEERLLRRDRAGDEHDRLERRRLRAAHRQGALCVGPDVDVVCLDP